MRQISSTRQTIHQSTFLFLQQRASKYKHFAELPCEDDKSIFLRRQIMIDYYYLFFKKNYEFGNIIPNAIDAGRCGTINTLKFCHQSRPHHHLKRCCVHSLATTTTAAIVFHVRICSTAAAVSLSVAHSRAAIQLYNARIVFLFPPWDMLKKKRSHHLMIFKHLALSFYFEMCGCLCEYTCIYIYFKQLSEEKKKVGSVFCCS